MRNALIAQGFMALLVMTVYGFVAEIDSVLGAAYGSLIAIANGLLLLWRYQRGNKHPHADPGRHLRSFFASTMERLFVVAVLFAVGIGALKLAPLPLLLGFIAGQAALLIAGLRSGNQ